MITGDLLMLNGYRRHYGGKSNDFYTKVLPDGRMIIAGDVAGIGADVYPTVKDYEAGMQGKALVLDAESEADLLEKIQKNL